MTDDTRQTTGNDKDVLSPAAGAGPSETDETGNQEKTPKAEQDYSRLIPIARGVAGGLGGGILGYFVTLWLYDHGFYGIILPGTLTGIVCGLVSRCKSIGLGIFCGLFGLAISIFTRWHLAASAAREKGFVWFLSSIPRLGTVTLLLLALGVFFGFWFGMGRARRARE